MSSHLRPLSFVAVGLLTAAFVLSTVSLALPMWYTARMEYGSSLTVTVQQGLFKTCSKSSATYYHQSPSNAEMECTDFPGDTTGIDDQPACSYKPTPTVGTVVARFKTAQAFAVMNVVTLGLLWLYRTIPTLFPVLVSTNQALFSQRRQCIATICLTLLSLAMALIALACFYGTFNVCSTYCDGRRKQCGPGASFICLIIEAAAAIALVAVAGVHLAKSPLAEPPAPLLTNQQVVPIYAAVDHPTGVQQSPAQGYVLPYQQLLQQQQEQQQQQQLQQ